jgi:hypothetical protein
VGPTPFGRPTQEQSFMEDPKTKVRKNLDTTETIGHRIEVTTDTDLFDVFISGSASGSFVYNGGSAASVTYWDRKPYPYHARFRLQASGYVPLRFDLYYTTPYEGRCRVYYLSYDWQLLGSGTFTDGIVVP